MNGMEIIIILPGPQDYPQQVSYGMDTDKGKVLLFRLKG